VEAALKMSEASHTQAVGFNCEAVPARRVGGARARRRGVPGGAARPSYERCLAAARVAKEVGAPVVALVREDDREISALAAETIRAA